MIKDYYYARAWHTANNVLYTNILLVPDVTGAYVNIMYHKKILIPYTVVGCIDFVGLGLSLICKDGILIEPEADNEFINRMINNGVLIPEGAHKLLEKLV